MHFKRRQSTSRQWTKLFLQSSFFSHSHSIRVDSILPTTRTHHRGLCLAPEFFAPYEEQIINTLMVYREASVQKEKKEYDTTQQSKSRRKKKPRISTINNRHTQTTIPARSTVHIVRLPFPFKDATIAARSTH